MGGQDSSKLLTNKDDNKIPNLFVLGKAIIHARKSRAINLRAAWKPSVPRNL